MTAKYTTFLSEQLLRGHVRGFEHMAPHPAVWLPAESGNATPA